jgi:hypothetical protein
MPGPRMTQEDRAELKEAVLFHACDLIARDEPPSDHRLYRRLPGHGKYTLAELREELIEEGRLVYDQHERIIPAERFPEYHAGVIKRTCRERARKIARGEVPELRA